MKGKLMVFEGLDSSGKATQSRLLEERLKEEKKAVERLSFPRYSEFFGSLIGKYLRGEFGKKEEVSVELVSLLYALDRYDAEKSITDKLSKGTILVLDRYSDSNLAYQGAKIRGAGKRNTFLEWAKGLESRLPKADIVFFLDIPIAMVKELMLGKDRVQEYRKGKKKDMHESDLDFLERVREVYLQLSEKEKKWVKVDCLDKKGKLKSREEIHEIIWGKAKEFTG